MKTPSRSLLAVGLVAAFLLPVSLGGGLGGGGVPYLFASGTPALADEVNANFGALVAGVSSNADDLELLASRTVDSQRIVRVAPEGGDFSSVREALASLVPLTESESTVVLVFPGTYEEDGACVVPSHVHLKGLDRETTRVRAQVVPVDGAVVRLDGDNAALSGISVENSSSLLGSTGVDVLGDNARIEDVRIGGHSNADGVYVEGAQNVLLRRVEVNPSEDALECWEGAGVTVEDSTLLARRTGAQASNGSTLFLKDTIVRSGDFVVYATSTGGTIRMSGGYVSGDPGAGQILVASEGVILGAGTRIGDGSRAATFGGRITLVHCYDEQSVAIPDQTIE